MLPFNPDLPESKPLSLFIMTTRNSRTISFISCLLDYLSWFLFHFENNLVNYKSTINWT